MAVLVNENNTKVNLSGASPARRARSTTNRPSPIVPKWSAGVTPGKGGQDHLWTCPCSKLCPRKPATVTKAKRDSHLRPRPLCSGIRSQRRSTPRLELIILHHRRPSLRLGHDARSARARRVQVAPSSGQTAPASITLDACKIGHHAGHIHKGAHVGLFSRSGTLTYESVNRHPILASANPLRWYRRRPHQRVEHNRYPRKMFPGRSRDTVDQFDRVEIGAGSARRRSGTSSWPTKRKKPLRSQQPFHRGPYKPPPAAAWATAGCGSSQAAKCARRNPKTQP